MNENNRIQRVHLIVNPHSGYGGNHIKLRQLREAAARAEIDVVEYTTRCAGDATRYAREQLPPHTQAVLVWGGDGTVNEVINGVSGRDIPVLPCPIGTENLLAKELHIPSGPNQIVRVLQAGQVVESDVGVINGRNFMLIVGIGFDGEVVRRLSATRTGHISHLSYFWPIWRTFWEHNFPRLRIVADGEEIINDYGLAFVGNTSRYSVGLRICRDAEYDDGLLDLVVFHCRQRTSLVLHAAWTLLRLHPLKGDVTYRKFRKAVIETDSSVSCQVDGDPGPKTPLNVSVASERVHLMVPPPNWRNHWPWSGRPQ